MGAKGCRRLSQERPGLRTFQGRAPLVHGQAGLWRGGARDGNFAPAKCVSTQTPLGRRHRGDRRSRCSACGVSRERWTGARLLYRSRPRGRVWTTIPRRRPSDAERDRRAAKAVLRCECVTSHKNVVQTVGSGLRPGTSPQILVFARTAPLDGSQVLP